MILSVVIPSRDRAENLFHTIEALKNQTLSKTEYEVIVVDDNSTDGTNDLLPDLRDNWNFKYIFSNVPKPHSWNASVIRNMGALIADSSTSAFVFVDSDVILPPHALQTYVDDLSENKDRVIIAPYDFYKQGNEQIAQPDVRNKKFDEVKIEDTFDSVHDGLACFGGNLVIPKDIFWGVGGFSPDIHIGLEDGDMGLKLWKKHTKFSYEARTRGKHQWHETPKDRFPTNMKEHIDKLNLKHYHTTDPDYGIIEASRDTYSSWGVIGWEPPKEWLANQIDMTLKMT